ncbi:MAG: SdpI family protein [Candidatus Cloacimonetes bacterium]|nr:SdpI family protein [Candidatus Cloacimonadota bacterium]
MQPNMIFGIINIATGIILICLSIPLAQRKIKMNRFYGFRNAKSFSSEENWYKINNYGAKQLIIWSIPLIFSGIVCFFIPIHDKNKDMMAIFEGIVPLFIFFTIPIIKIIKYSKKI